jgi:hypothetical protein
VMLGEADDSNQEYKWLCSLVKSPGFSDHEIAIPIGPQVLERAPKDAGVAQTVQRKPKVMARPAIIAAVSECHAQNLLCSQRRDAIQLYDPLGR